MYSINARLSSSLRCQPPSIGATFQHSAVISLVKECKKRRSIAPLHVSRYRRYLGLAAQEQAAPDLQDKRGSCALVLEINFSPVLGADRSHAAFPSLAWRARSSLGVLPVQRLWAWVNALTSR